MPTSMPFWPIMGQPSRGLRVENLQHGPLYFKYFQQFKEKPRLSLSVPFAPRLYNSYNHTHAPRFEGGGLGPALLKVFRAKLSFLKSARRTTR